MDNNKEKYLSESLLSEEPKKKFVLKLKRNSVTGDKIAPNAVGWDKLSQRIKDLFAAIQAAIGEPVDPETIKEMVRNTVREIIDSGDEIIDEDALVNRITQTILDSLGEEYPSFKLDDSEISDSDLINQPAPSGTVGEVVFSTTLHTFLFKDTGQFSPNYGKYYKTWEGSDDYLINNNAGPKKGVIFMVSDGSDYYYWDGHNLVPLGSKEEVDIDTVAERVAEIIHIETEGKNFIPFDGVMDKASSVNILDAKAPQGVEGDILFYAKTGTFIYGVHEEPDPASIIKYYKYWEGWTDYKDAQDKPQSKVVFVLRNGSSYYYWDGSEFQEFVTETSMAATIDALDIEAVPIKGNNGVEVEVVTEVVDGKTVKVKTASLADIPKDSNNMIGTTYNFNSLLPIESKTTGSTKHIITSNILGQITGYDADNQPIINTSKITLPKGSKIVPNGGIAKIPVEGGERSWVHSSDIGMIQSTNKSSDAIARANYAALRAAVESNYNVILDGSYYVNSNKNMIPIDRDFRIKEGTLYSKDNLFCILPGGSFYANNINFYSPESGYSRFLYVCPAGPSVNDTSKIGYIDAIEIVNCTFNNRIPSLSYDNTTTGIKEYQTSVVVITGGQGPQDVIEWNRHAKDDKNNPKPTKSYPYICPSWTPVYENWKSASDKAVAGSALANFMTKSSEEDDYIYYFDSTYTIEVAESGARTIKRNGADVPESTWDDAAIGKHLKTDDYLMQTNASDSSNYIFIVNETGEDLIDTGVWGYFIKYSDATEEERAEAYKDGQDAIIYYTQVVNDDVVTADGLGIKRLYISGCTFDNSCIDIADMQIKDYCEISNNSFVNCAMKPGVSISTYNENPYSDIWTSHNCPLIFKNNLFKGPGEPACTGQGNYACGLLLETQSAYVSNCTFENIIADHNSWGCYSIYYHGVDLVFENNVVSNILAMRKATHIPEYHILKAKSGGTAIDGRRPRRIFRNNRYSFNYTSVYKMCRKFLWEWYRGELPIDSSDSVIDAVVKEKFDQYMLKQPLMNHLLKNVNDLEIVGNTFDFPDCTLCGEVNNHGTWGKLLVKDNYFNFKKANLPFNSFLFNYDSLHQDAYSEIRFENNTFKLVEPSAINLFSERNSTFAVNYLSIQDNTFINCYLSVTCGYKGNGRNILNADKVFIKNNKHESTSSIPYSTTNTSPIIESTAGKLSGNGDLIRYSVKDYAEIEVEDVQYNDGVLGAGRFIEIPVCGGCVTFKSKYINRPLNVGTSGYVRKDSNMILFRWNGGNNVNQDGYVNDTGYFSKTKDRAAGWYPTKSLYGGGLGVIKFGIDVTYTVKGLLKHKHMELIHSRMVTAAATSIRYGQYTTLVRDINGIDTYHYGNGITILDMPAIEDIGLGFRWEIMDLTYNYNTLTTMNETDSCYGAAHLYAYSTAEGGTYNDAGSDIIIKIYKMPNVEKYPNNTTVVNPEYITPLKSFVEHNSEVTAEWLATTAAKFSRGYINSNGSSKTDVIPYIRPEDTGLRVHVGKQWYTCNGTQWVPDKAVVSLTQAEYDALTTKDENTLYLITYPQS